MSERPKPPGIAEEVQLVLEEMRRFPWAAESSPDPEQLVQEQPQGVYRLPSFLGKTAPKRLSQELRELFAEVRALNNSLAGERLVEAELILALDEWSFVLKKSLWSWGRTYVEERLAKRHNGDHSEVHRFVRLVDEVDEIFYPPAQQQHSVNGLILRGSARRAKCHVYERTLRGYLRFHRLPWNSALWPRGRALYEQLVGPIPGWRPTEMAKYRLLEYLIEARFPIETIRPAYLELRASIPAEQLQGPARPELERRLRRLAEDFQAVRPFLVNRVRRPDTIVSAGGKALLSWEWDRRSGLGWVLLGSAEEQASAVETGTAGGCRHYGVDLEGLPVEMPSGCRSIEHLEPEEQRQFLELHLIALQVLLQRLCTLWDGLYAAQRQVGPAAEPASEEELALLSSRIAAKIQGEPDAEASGEPDPVRTRVPPLRLSQLTGVLQRLGVQVRVGKGSEIVLCRADLHYTLGRHKRNPVVSVYRVRSILKKLQIGLPDFALQAGG
jgi:hypothetical protein